MTKIIPVCFGAQGPVAKQSYPVVSGRDADMVLWRHIRAVNKIDPVVRVVLVPVHSVDQGALLGARLATGLVDPSDLAGKELPRSWWA